MNQLIKGLITASVANVIAENVKEIPASIWESIKNRLRYQVVLDDRTEIYDAFNEWFLANYPMAYRSVEISFKTEYSKGYQTFKTVKTQYEDDNYIVYKGKYIFITKQRDILEGASSKTSRVVNTYFLECYQGKDAIDDIIQKLEKDWNDKKAVHQGIRVVVTDKWADSRTIHITNYKSLDKIYIDGKEKLIDDIKNFYDKRDLYKRNGIRFKRGYMLYGPPGTGKTSLVWAIAEWLDVPIYYLNPSGFSSDDSFEDFFAGVENGSIVLIEEVDVFWEDRKGSGKTGVSFQSLLNVLDGVHSPEDVLIFMTTNRPDNFDEAFMRKGRLDFKLLIDFPSKKQVEHYLSDFYGEPVKLSTYKKKHPMVDIQDVCIKSDTLTKALKKLS